MRFLILVLMLQGCASIGMGDAIRNAGVFCGTVVGMGYTGRVGVANLDKGVLKDGSITCAPDGTLTITATTTQKPEPVKP